MLAAIGLLSVGALCAQDGYPSKPTRLVVPYPPGGPTDIVARITADKMQGLIGQAMIVDNRPGAGTNIGNVVRDSPQAGRRGESRCMFPPSSPSPPCAYLAGSALSTKRDL